MRDLRGLRLELDKRNIPVEIVADEMQHADDIKYFADNSRAHDTDQDPDLAAFITPVKQCCTAQQGGAIRAAPVTRQTPSRCVVRHGHRPDQILAKPGMGVDEGYMIVVNEMNRLWRCVPRGGSSEMMLAQGISPLCSVYFAPRGYAHAANGHAGCTEPPDSL